MGEGIRDHQPRAVGAEAAAVRQEAAEPGVLLCEIGRPCVHHAQAEALDLLGPEALPVPTAVRTPVGGQISRLAQGVHRVRQDDEEAPESRLL